MLDRLNAFNNTPKKEQKPVKPVPQVSTKPSIEKKVESKKKEEPAKPKQAPVKKQDPVVEKSNVTFVMTACGRPDLMERTLDSFFKYNSYKIDRYIITEDSMDEESFNECKRLNKEKYNNKIEFIFNERKLGQAASIDLAYSKVETKYVFHCEEDWEFYRSGFVEKSLKILEHDNKILQAWIRPKSDNILNRIDSNIYEIEGVKVRDVLPVSFQVANAKGPGKHLIVNNYMGFTWNPGLKRISDYKLLKKGYSGIKEEHMVDAFYRSHKNGFKVVSISVDDDWGFVKHIGWGRRADNPTATSNDKSPKELNQAIEDAKKKRAEDKKKMEELEAKRKAEEAKAAEKNSQPVKMPMVSIVMQSYLGDYPGARSNPIDKFHRAINSFLSQKYVKSELIIVSDGCDITHEEYHKVYKNNPRVKYAYVSKEGPNMYEKVNDKRQYRGVPRRIGVSLAEGDIISYMDSDDLLLPGFLPKIAGLYLKYPDCKWFINREWFDHINVFHPNWIQANGVGISVEPHSKEDIINLQSSLGVSIVKTKMKDGYVVSTPWLVSHHADCNVRWENTEYPTSEDVAFCRILKDKYPNGVYYNDATYLRCHYKGAWDF